jgi:hypothetical protein
MLANEQLELMLARSRVQVPALPKPAIAPYNGYGTLRDSEQNCRSLVPKPPKKDLRKLVNKDGMILRFVTKFSPRPDLGFEVRPTFCHNAGCFADATSIGRPHWFGALSRQSAQVALPFN